MEHLIIIDPTLKGREYGTLTSMQFAIQKVTNAESLILPELGGFEKNFIQASRWRILRKLSRKKNLEINSNVKVLWYILMGPENYRLDQFTGFEQVPHKIIYFFDTLPHQIDLIARLNLKNYFSIRISSFNDSIAVLQKKTNYKWHFFSQASIRPRRVINRLEDKKIAFCSYGRSSEKLNRVIKNFCDKNSLYFDYTHESQGNLKSNNMDLYYSYLWHTSMSIFNVSFAVELTDPDRSGYLSPITCRWFEAILSSNIVIGQAPKNPEFINLFPSNLVHNIDLNCSEKEIYVQIQKLWDNREFIFNSIYSQLSDSLLCRYEWEYRVLEICNQFDLCAE